MSHLKSMASITRADGVGRYSFAAPSGTSLPSKTLYESYPIPIRGSAKNVMHGSRCNRSPSPDDDCKLSRSTGPSRRVHTFELMKSPLTPGTGARRTLGQDRPWQRDGTEEVL
jgi:hypothetical protein